MLTPAAKRRRRAEEATAVLKRPFRSPAVRTQPDKGHAFVRAAPVAAAPASDAAPSIPSPERKHKRAAVAAVAAAAASLADLVAQFERDLDAGDRAIQRANASPPKRPHKEDGKDDTGSELPALIARWREAGRTAAEEVFELVSERVARAGGARAWRSMMRQAGSENYQEEQSARRPRHDDEDAEREERDDETREGEEGGDEEEVQTSPISNFNPCY